MRRLIIFVTVFTLIAGSSLIAYADNLVQPVEPSKKIMVYLQPDITVELQGEKQNLTDSAGAPIYPLIYNGSAYLPVRPVFSMINMPVDWDKASNTVFIGKTLSNPTGEVKAVQTTSAAIQPTTAAIQLTAENSNATAGTSKAAMVPAYIRADVLVMYNFEIQSFQDESGAVMHPVVCNGSAYLPIHELSRLMKETIEWDGQNKAIYIGDKDSIDTATGSAIKETDKISSNAKYLKKQFDKVEVLYYEATGKATTIKKATPSEEKKLIAASITDNYNKAQAMSVEIKGIDTASFTDAEKAALDKLKAYSESTEYYILVLENISYLAAQDNDYSMLADTFLYFAMDSQNKMEDARSAIKALK